MALCCFQSCLYGFSWFIFLPGSVYFYPGEVHCEQPNNSLYTFTGNLIIQHQTLPLSPNQLLLRVRYNLLIIFLIVKRLFAHCIEVLKGDIYTALFFFVMIYIVAPFWYLCHTVQPILTLLFDLQRVAV